MSSTPDIARGTLSFAVVGILLLTSLAIVRPFLPATVWAITIVVATWPLLLRLQRILWGSRALAVATTSLVVLVVFVVPFWLATATILDHTDELFELVRSSSSFRIPPVPHWVAAMPVAGNAVAHAWTGLEDAGLSQLAPRVAPYAGRVTRWFLGFLGSFGLLVAQFLLTVIVTAILHANGEGAARFALAFGHRLAGEGGQRMVILAGHAIRAVAIGVTVTALVESAVGGLGLRLAGVPFSTVLTAVTFVVCLTQIGPGVVLLPAVVWMYWSRDAMHATVLLVVSLVAITIDNVLRPFLIRRSADLPTLLVLIGVLGGLSAFGLVGIFVGPAVLAVSYTVLQAWLAEGGGSALAARGSPALSPPPASRGLP